MVVYSLSQEYLKENVIERQRNTIIEENFSQTHLFVSQDEKVFGNFGMVSYLPKVFSFDGVYSLDYTSTTRLSIVPTKMISYQDGVKVKGKNFEVVAGVDKTLSMCVYENFSIKTKEEGEYIGKFHFAVRNSIEFVYHSYIPPLSVVVENRTKKEYKTIYCFKESENSFLYIAILWSDDILITTNIFSETEDEEQKSRFISNVALAGLDGIRGGVYQLSKNWENGRYFDIWVSNEEETEFFSGNSRQVVALLHEVATISTSIKKLELAIYGSVYQGGYTKVHFFEIPAVIVSVYTGSFSVVNEQFYKNISGGYTNIQNISVGTITDTTTFDIFYQTLTGVWVKNGMTFFEGGVSFSSQSNGLAGCYYYIQPSSGQMRIGAKASVVNSTMYYMVLKWNIKLPPKYIFEGSITTNPQLVFSILEKPSFFIVRLGDDNEWYFEKEWGHFFNLTSTAFTAHFGALNEKQLILENGRWNLYVKMNNIYSFSNITYRPTRFKAIVW